MTAGNFKLGDYLKKGVIFIERRFDFSFAFRLVAIKFPSSRG
jgi:hypothetical protein